MVVQAPGLAVPVGFVAAGGRSRRMGRDKALLPWEGATLLDHAIARLRAVVDEVAILCGPTPRYEDRGLPLVLDAYDDAGPLAGLDAALGAADGRPVLLLGVDLPFVTPEVLGRLVTALDGSDAVVPIVGARPQPLCAVYGPACRPAVRARLEGGDRKMTSVLEDVAVRALDLEDVAHLFRNLNTPQDLADARARPRDKRPESL